MEAAVIYSHYNLCEFQGCQCRSCGHDQAGNCLADTGDCAGAAEQKRCPIRGCPMFEPRQ